MLTGSAAPFSEGQGHLSLNQGRHFHPRDVGFKARKAEANTLHFHRRIPSRSQYCHKPEQLLQELNHPCQQWTSDAAIGKWPPGLLLSHFIRKALEHSMLIKPIAAAVALAGVSLGVQAADTVPAPQGFIEGSHATLSSRTMYFENDLREGARAADQRETAECLLFNFTSGYTPRHGRLWT